MSWVLCAVLMTPQARSTPLMPAFESVSVKPSSSSPDAQIETPAVDRFTATHVTIRDLIRFAYNIESPRVFGLPDWVESERFDVVGIGDRAFPISSETGPPSARDPITLMLMVRRLLADRFGVIVHQETRELAVYTLLVSRDDQKFGPEIAPSKRDCDGAAPAAVSRTGSSGPACGMLLGPGQLTMSGAPMSQLAMALSNVAQRFVIDRTNLPGTFDFRLRWTDSNDVSLSAALREQLGLTLESARASIDVLVIDRVERPSPD